MKEDIKCNGIDCFACPNPECPNEKKSIIIDDVDVSECSQLCKVVNEEPYCDSSNTIKFACKGNNCNYKQLKRLKTEKEELKTENEELKERVENFREFLIRPHASVETTRIETFKHKLLFTLRAPENRFCLQYETTIDPYMRNSKELATEIARASFARMIAKRLIFDFNGYGEVLREFYED